MKLSAIFVSVNIAATLPVAAQASEEAISDKAEWLRQNLAALSKTNTANFHKTSLSNPDLSSFAKEKPLRPFVANRKLPSKHDLELELMAQRTRIEEIKLSQSAQIQADSNLSGQMPILSGEPERSPYSLIPDSLIGRPDKLGKYGRRPAAATIFGQTATLPGQIAYQPGSPAAVSFVVSSPPVPNQAMIPVIPEPPAYQAGGNREMRPDANTLGTNKQNLNPGEHMVRQSGALLVQAPVLTPDEKSMFNELMELNHPGHSQQFVDLPGHEAKQFRPAQASGESSAEPGPPPFPLNMLPKGALNELIGHQKVKNHAPPCYFGGWHKPIALSNPTETGFQKSTARHGNNKYLGHYAPTGTHTNSLAAHSKKHQFDTLTSQRLAYSKGEIALYPPYGR